MKKVLTTQYPVLSRPSQSWFRTWVLNTRYLLLLLVVLVSAAGQDKTAPYFTLTSSRTFAPGETPAIQMWGQSVSSLEFRVYRVNDPVKFFARLRDVHNFGGRAPRPPHSETWLERFHRWKRGLWLCIRDFVRAQFSRESRANIRERISQRDRQPAQNVQTFAQVPLLNSQQLVARWNQAISRPENRWESENVSVPVRDKGLYLVEAVHEELRAYTIVLITDIAVITKTSPDKVLNFVADRQSGAPVPGATVLLWGGTEQLAAAQSDAHGLVESQISKNSKHPLVLVQKDNSFAVNAPFGEGGSEETEAADHTYVYTDRPIYRPGDTVHFKAILRQQAGATYRIPKLPQVNVAINDPEYKPVAQQSLTPNDMGTAHGDWTVPPGAHLGTYWLAVGGNEGGNAQFDVQEYKKPEYQVRVTADKRVLQGQPIKATIDARYYFGEPVANAKVKTVVHVSRYWRWNDEDADDQDTDADQSDADNEYEGGAGDQALEIPGKLDDQGKLEITVPTRVSSKHEDAVYRLEARVTDEANREISGKGFALATYANFSLFIQPDSYVYQPNGTAKLTVEARDYDDHPVETDFQLVLRTWNWREREKYSKTVFATSGRTDASGKSLIEVHLSESGSLEAKVTARTPEGREPEGRAYLWVSGSAAMWGKPSESIQIIPDRKSYKPGDTAHLLVVNGTAPADLLVTVEGNELFTQQVVHATGPSTTVEVPIRAEYEPDFYASVYFLKDNQLRTGNKEVKVPPAEHALRVELQPSKPQFQPGEAASYTIRAHDSAGQPVAGEFSLGVVDEAIYAIQPESAQDIMRFYWGRAWNRVMTETSLTYWFQGAAGKRKMELTGVRPTRSLAQLKPERLVEPKIRKAFPDTAFWVADVNTDAQGEAQTRFNFPDALTTWRATTRGVTPDTRVGSAVEKVIVRKNLMLRLAVPRFFRQGDEVVVSALVHNYLTTAKKARVSLDLTGLEVIDGGTRDVDVPVRGEVKVDWRVRAQSVRSAVILGKALTNEESDAMELTLPVIPYGARLTVARSGSITADKSDVTDDIVFPGQSEPGSRGLDLKVTPSVAGTVLSALDFLTAYPYGCTEQTMSSFLPNIIVARAMKELNLKSNVNQEELNKKIAAGLNRLRDYQHDDGGWGWWQTDDSQIFMTAYVLQGLAQAHAAGYEMQDRRKDAPAQPPHGTVAEGTPTAMQRAQVWLQNRFYEDTKIVSDLRAYMAYALSESGMRDPAMLDSVWQQRSGLTVYGAALLGLALQASGDARSGELATRLESEVKSGDQQAWWQLDHSPLLEYYGDASVEATAFAVRFLARVRPQSPTLPQAALWLVDHRSGYYWDSTFQTALAIFGLTDYLKTGGELKPNFSVEVLVNDKSVLKHSFTAADGLAPSVPGIHLTDEQLASANHLQIRKHGSGRLYWSASGEYYSTEPKSTNMGSFQLNVAREYFKLVSAQQEKKIVYHMEKLNGPVQPGDVLAVHVTVSGGNWRYLMIEDPFLAGAEPIERDDLFEIVDRPQWWGSWWWARREFYDDHAAFFVDWFNHGQHEFRYLLKVVNLGKFRVSPTRVEPMYQPQYLATGDGLTVAVAPLSGTAVASPVAPVPDVAPVSRPAVAGVSMPALAHAAEVK
ncbi:MAG: MG2 domain-containing protein [Terriglobales bacterium]